MSLLCLQFKKFGKDLKIICLLLTINHQNIFLHEYIFNLCCTDI